MEKPRWVSSDRSPGDLDGLRVVLWHGAGGDIEETSLAAVASSLSSLGASVARARFGYRRLGKKMPDRMPVLLEDAERTIAELGALEGVRSDRLILGGRSMGGRVASMLVAGGFRSDGLLLLSYPLHKEGRTDELRDAHLSKIACPVLFISGDKDPMCDLDLLQRAIAPIRGTARVEVLEGANHSPKKKAHIAQIAELAAVFAREVAGRPS
jgi:uncharacterized protein